MAAEDIFCENCNNVNKIEKKDSTLSRKQSNKKAKDTLPHH